jgi:hypothetical protein
MPSRHAHTIGHGLLMGSGVGMAASGGLSPHNTARPAFEQFQIVVADRASREPGCSSRRAGRDRAQFVQSEAESQFQVVLVAQVDAEDLARTVQSLEQRVDVHM